MRSIEQESRSEEELAELKKARKSYEDAVNLILDIVSGVEYRDDEQDPLKKATNLLAKSLAIQEKYSPETTYESLVLYALTLSAVAEAYSRRGKNDEAKEYHLRAIAAADMKPAQELQTMHELELCRFKESIYRRVVRKTDDVLVWNGYLKLLRVYSELLASVVTEIEPSALVYNQGSWEFNFKSSSLARSASSFISSCAWCYCHVGIGEEVQDPQVVKEAIDLVMSDQMFAIAKRCYARGAATEDRDLAKASSDAAAAPPAALIRGEYDDRQIRDLLSSLLTYRGIAPYRSNLVSYEHTHPPADYDFDKAGAIPRGVTQFTRLASHPNLGAAPREVQPKIFEYDGKVFVNLNPATLRQVLRDREFFDFPFILAEGIFELQNFLRENEASKGKPIIFTVAINKGDQHWVAGFITISPNRDKISAQINDPIGWPSIESVVFEEIRGIIAEKLSRKTREQLPEIMMPGVLITPDIEFIVDSRLSDIQRGVYCGGAVRRMIAGQILNGDPYNWSGIDVEGHVVTKDYADSHAARIADAALLPPGYVQAEARVSPVKIENRNRPLVGHLPAPEVSFLQEILRKKIDLVADNGANIAIIKREYGDLLMASSEDARIYQADLMMSYVLKLRSQLSRSEEDEKLIKNLRKESALGGNKKAQESYLKIYRAIVEDAFTAAFKKGVKSAIEDLLLIKIGKLTSYIEEGFKEMLIGKGDDKVLASLKGKLSRSDREDCLLFHIEDIPSKELVRMICETMSDNRQQIEKFSKSDHAKESCNIYKYKTVSHDVPSRHTKSGYRTKVEVETDHDSDIVPLKRIYTKLEQDFRSKVAAFVKENILKDRSEEAQVAPSPALRIIKVERIAASDTRSRG